MTDYLTEVTFRNLINLTRSNGSYRYGGLRKVAGRWVTDFRVKGRIQNSAFVVTRQPKPKIGPNGFLRIEYNFKSQPDRSTTGLRQKGYIEFVPSTKKKFVAKNGWDSDVRVFCTCPDFKFRWHKVLSDRGASHTPTGQGGEAINADPVITNPGKKLSLCKHLTAMASYIASSNTDIQKFNRMRPSPKAVSMSKKKIVPKGADIDASSPDTVRKPDTDDTPAEKPTQAEWNYYRKIGDSSSKAFLNNLNEQVDIKT